MTDSLINKLLDGHIELNKNFAKVQELLERHDEVTFPEIKQSIKEIKDKSTIDAKIVEDLCKIVSRGDGRMTDFEKNFNDLKAKVESNSKANKMIDEITTTWKVGKAVVSFTISGLLLLVAIKTLIYGGIREGLSAIKNLI